jgi:DegV family protein with EDD domain
VLQLREPAGQVHVLTDSTADLDPSEARRLGIQVAAVSIQFGTELYRDGIDLSPEAFHRRLGETRELPRSHPVSRGELLETLRRLVVSGDVLIVMCSSALSQSVENARGAVAEGMPEFVRLRREAGVAAEPALHVVDSRQCSGALGMLVVFARRMLHLKMAPAEVARRLESMSARFRTLLMVHSLEYLHRGRGIGDAQQVARQRPGNRWLLVLEAGELKVVAEADQAAARVQLLERLGQGIDPARPVLGTLVHASAPADAARLRERLLERFDVRDLKEHPIGPAVTCNAGPGAVGAALLQPTDEELELLGYA